jgi:hypothetical protein
VIPGQQQGADQQTGAAEGPVWREPAITATLLTICVAYVTVHVSLGRWYGVPRYHYLTPFYREQAKRLSMHPRPVPDMDSGLRSVDRAHGQRDHQRLRFFN